MEVFEVLNKVEGAVKAGINKVTAHLPEAVTIGVVGAFVVGAVTYLMKR